jgi:hypothetical protein
MVSSVKAMVLSYIVAGELRNTSRSVVAEEEAARIGEWRMADDGM